MKFTICGYNQTVLLEHNLTLDDVFILKVISSIYFSQSEKISSMIFENCKYIWLSYKYIHKEIPIIGTERTLINRINSLVEKGFLKKIVKNRKDGKTGKFLYFSLGENYSLITGENKKTEEKVSSNQMKDFHEGNEKTSSEPMKNFHIKDQLYNINNTNIKKKYIKPDNCQPFVIDIMKKYEELNLPDYEFLPDNSVFVNCIQALGAEKLFKALEIMSQSEYAKTFSINMIFNIKNLKKALNGNYRDRSSPIKNRIIQEPEYEEDREAEEILRKLGF